MPWFGEFDRRTAGELVHSSSRLPLRIREWGCRPATGSLVEPGPSAQLTHRTLVPDVVPDEGDYRELELYPKASVEAPT